MSKLTFKAKRRNSWKNLSYNSGILVEKFTEKPSWSDSVMANGLKLLAAWNMGLSCGQLVGNCAASIMRFRKGRAGASARGLTRAYLQAVPQRQ